MDDPRASQRSGDDCRFALALARIDAAHAEDPATETVGGSPRPRELVYAERLSEWLERLEPAASPALRLAVRCQHLCRWRVARSSYPVGRAGYHAWRRACQQMHAELAAEHLAAVGYDEQTIARVGELVRKRNLGSDPEVQVLEDVACLVFLEHELAAFAVQHDESKTVDIVRRTWRKMSPRGQRAALELELSADASRLIRRALE